MPDIFGGHYKRFLEWMLVSGRIEHGLGDVFLTTIVEAIGTCRNQQKARSWPETTSPNELSDERVGNGGGDVNGGMRLRLTRLAAAIYDARPELQRYFPDPCGHDSARFLVWLLTYGRKEHYLSPTQLAPFKAQWQSRVGGLPHWWTRVRFELVLMGMGASVRVRSFLERLPVWRARFKRRRSLSQWRNGKRTSRGRGVAIPARAWRQPGWLFQFRDGRGAIRPCCPGRAANRPCSVKYSLCIRSGPEQ